MPHRSTGELRELINMDEHKKRLAAISTAAKKSKESAADAKKPPLQLAKDMAAAQRKGGGKAGSGLLPARGSGSLNRQGSDTAAQQQSSSLRSQLSALLQPSDLPLPSLKPSMIQPSRPHAWPLDDVPYDSSPAMTPSWGASGAPTLASAGAVTAPSPPLDPRLPTPQPSPMKQPAEQAPAAQPPPAAAALTNESGSAGEQLATSGTAGALKQRLSAVQQDALPRPLTADETGAAAERVHEGAEDREAGVKRTRFQQEAAPAPPQMAAQPAAEDVM